MKIYVTFGFQHIHKINGKIFDRNCVGVIDRPNYEEGRKAITDIFDNVFCTTYTEEHIMKNLHYYPRGIIEIE